MSIKRFISVNSKNKVYHMNGCPYEKRILEKNKMCLLRNEAEKIGYCSCKYCNNMVFHYKKEKESIVKFAEKNNIKVEYKENKVFVRTDRNCWKICYRRDKEVFYLMHRNKNLPSDVKIWPGDRNYHMQKDVPSKATIMKYMDYISKHDRFKPLDAGDYKKMPRTTKEQKKYYGKAKRFYNKKAYNNVMNLFAMIEQGNQCERMAMY